MWPPGTCWCSRTTCRCPGFCPWSSAGRTGPPREGPVLARRAYTYRPGGWLAGVDDLLAGSRRFTLDGQGRITAVTGPGGPSATATTRRATSLRRGGALRRPARPACGCPLTCRALARARARSSPAPGSSATGMTGRAASSSGSGPFSRPRRTRPRVFRPARPQAVGRLRADADRPATVGPGQGPRRGCPPGFGYRRGTAGQRPERQDLDAIA
jgi:hypothetical protein